MKNRSNAVNISMFLLTVFVAVLTSIFVIRYCNLFDDFGMIAKRRLLENPLLTFFITPFFFWISAFLCRKYSPHASGNHLQSALKRLKTDPNNFEKTSDFLNIRLVMIKAISSLVASLGGGSLGKEGPSVHMSAGIFATLAEKYKKFLPKITLETWVLAGTSTGLAIAFNAPISGIIFAVEKISKTKFRNFKSNILWVLITISIVTLVFYKPNPIFDFHNFIFVIDSTSLLLVFTAAVCGALAFFLQSANNYFYPKFFNIRSNWWHLIPVIAGIAVAYINFYCGIYSFSGGINTAQEALSSDASFLSYKEVFGRILNTFLTFVSGCAGGLIAPAMAIGAGIGSIASHFTADMNLTLFLLIGMTAFLSAILGEPITAAFVIFEATGQDIKNMPILLVASLISLMVFRGIGKIKR